MSLIDDLGIQQLFFKSMKGEELYRIKYCSERELKKAVEDYIIFYNEQRPHTILHYKTPEQ